MLNGGVEDEGFTARKLDWMDALKPDDVYVLCGGAVRAMNVSLGWSVSTDPFEAYKFAIFIGANNCKYLRKP
jgi:hypothetical protein